MNRVIYPADAFEELHIRTCVDLDYVKGVPELESIMRSNMQQAIAEALLEHPEVLDVLQRTRIDLVGCPMEIQMKLVVKKAGIEPVGYLIDKPPEAS